MSYSQDRQSNQAPATSLDSAEYLTNRQMINEYELIQMEHLHHPSWLERLSDRSSVRRVARETSRFMMLLIAFCIAGAVLYYLQHDATLAIGE